MSFNLFDCLILCRFYRDMYSWDKLERLFCALTGENFTKASLSLRAGAVQDLVRHFNLKEGITAADDDLPQALYRRADDTQLSIEPEIVKKMVTDYYALRGWTNEGVPPGDNE